MTEDLVDERRSEKNTIFLQGLENYIVELAKGNHGTSPDLIVALFKQNFNRSMLASAEYHEQMQEENRNAGENGPANFDKLQAQIYRSIITN